jgi:hypothetical protein
MATIGADVAVSKAHGEQVYYFISPCGASRNLNAACDGLID